MTRTRQTSLESSGCHVLDIVHSVTKQLHISRMLATGLAEFDAWLLAVLHD